MSDRYRSRMCYADSLGTLPSASQRGASPRHVLTAVCSGHLVDTFAEVGEPLVHVKRGARGWNAAHLLTWHSRCAAGTKVPT